MNLAYVTWDSIQRTANCFTVITASVYIKCDRKNFAIASILFPLLNNVFGRTGKSYIFKFLSNCCFERV